MKTLILAVFVCISTLGIAQQKYFTRSGQIYFISHTDVIDIDGNNNQVASFLDIESGEMMFAVLNKAFEFELATAKEHFNESYIESDKYPKSKFKGKIVDIANVDFSKDGEYNVTVEGELSIHGASKKIKTNGVLKVKGEKVFGVSEFDVAIADFNIKVPDLVKDRVAKTVSIKVEMNYEPYKK